MAQTDSFLPMMLMTDFALRFHVEYLRPPAGCRLKATCSSSFMDCLSVGK